MGKLNDWRVLVSGSQNWTDEEAIRMALSKVWKQSEILRLNGSECILVHPTTRGTAEMASRIWLELGGAVEPHAADWEGFRSLAPFVRSKAMVDKGADLAIVFIKAGDKVNDRLANLTETNKIYTWRIES